MVPAEASAPRIKLTGPDAEPPPSRGSSDDRIRERFTPAPDPPLKMMPSSRYQLRIDAILSSTDKMKQALACWGTSGTPMLNQTGLLKAARWVTRMYFSSARNAAHSSSSAKYPSARPHSVIVSTMRSITCLSEDSRSGLPTVPRKYFCVTMLVALSDQLAGNSTPICSNTVEPSSQLVIRASRDSHTTSSNG